MGHLPLFSKKFVTGRFGDKPYEDVLYEVFGEKWLEVSQEGHTLVLFPLTERIRFTSWRNVVLIISEDGLQRVKFEPTVFSTTSCPLHCINFIIGTFQFFVLLNSQILVWIGEFKGIWIKILGVILARLLDKLCCKFCVNYFHPNHLCSTRSTPTFFEFSYMHRIWGLPIFACYPRSA